MAKKDKPKSKPQAEAGTRIQAKYDAAGTGRRMRGWMPPTSGPNRAIEGLQKIRDRARDVVRNDWSGESASQKWTTNLIGIGITPRVTRITDTARRRELSDLWSDWSDHADADGIMTFYGLQTLAVRTWLDSGEVFIRKRPRRAAFGMDVPLQVQLIEPDFVPLLDADTWPGMPTGNRLRSGIELDNRNQRIAYWVWREHPGDNAAVIDPSKLLRIPSGEIQHMFEPKRPGQLRGVSALAPVLVRLRNVNDFDDAVLERQKLANLFTGFITQQMAPDGNIDPLTGLPIEYDGATALAGLAPGMFQELDPGQDVKFSNPPEAGTTYTDYMRTQHLGTAAAAGLPYELFSGDIKEVSDRSMRVIINEFRRFAEQRQWQIIIPMLCQPVRNWWTEACALAGYIAPDEADAVRRVQWSPHGWAYIHPVQDPQGKQLEVASGFRSRSSVIGERGDDPEQVDEERAADQKRAEALGLRAVAADDPRDEKDKPEEQGDQQPGGKA
jgi:lambda family phage portal protein